jgi:hypothetical protein
MEGRDAREGRKERWKSSMKDGRKGCQGRKDGRVEVNDDRRKEGIPGKNRRKEGRKGGRKGRSQ